MYPHWVTEVIVPSGVRDTCPQTDDLSTNADRQLSDQRDSAVTRRSYGITTDVLSCSAKLKTRRQTLPSIIIRRYLHRSRSQPVPKMLMEFETLVNCCLRREHMRHMSLSLST